MVGEAARFTEHSEAAQRSADISPDGRENGAFRVRERALPPDHGEIAAVLGAAAHLDRETASFAGGASRNRVVVTDRAQRLNGERSFHQLQEFQFALGGGKAGL